jgi:hypothetical protein
MPGFMLNHAIDREHGLKSRQSMQQSAITGRDSEIRFLAPFSHGP